MSTSPSKSAQLFSSVASSSSSAAPVVNSTGAASSVVNSAGAAGAAGAAGGKASLGTKGPASKNHCDKTCVCNGDPERLFGMFKTFGAKRVFSEHPKLIQKAKDGGWIRQEFFVKNCTGTWKMATGKRKRPPTSDEFLALAVKRQKSLSKQLVVYNAKLAEIKLDIELMEVAKDMLLLKAKADAMKGAMAQ